MEVQDNSSPSNEIAVNADSAPANQLTEQPETNGNDAVNADSAPAEVETADENTDYSGSEPPKAVKELIAQRKKRQEAEKARQESDREAAYWRGIAEAKGYKPETSPQNVPQNVTPDLVQPQSENYETWADFEKAEKRYLIETAKREFRAEMQQQTVQQQHNKVQSTFWEKVETISENDDPYIKETIANVGRIVNPVVADLVVQSDMGIDLVKYFNTNQKEAIRLSQLHPIMAAKEIGKIEARLANAPKPQPPKRVSQAPTPIKTVTPVGSTNTFDPETASMDEYYRRRMSQLHPRK